ncbi:MAG: branched-chain amino acid ABC transporter ATP-binding protein [Archaeoglobales archaeon]|nr:MAG: branched-chain amino acid ABC transporter ATP-binding protein [Archaeoglobales archaeon]
MLLSVDNLRAYYGKLEVLHGVSICVDRGESVCILGPNGAGKTTLLKSICGLVSYEGEVLFEGLNLNGLKPYERIKLGIALCPEGRRLFLNMSVEDNLIVAGDDVDYAYKLFPRLKERRKEKAKNLRGGEQQMLAIARSLLLKPKILLLDEPSMGLAPIVVESLSRVIEEISKEVSILIVEQNVSLAMDISDRCYILTSGRIVDEGEVGEIDLSRYFK